VTPSERVSSTKRRKRNWCVPPAPKNTPTVATVDGTAIHHTPTSTSARSANSAADSTVRPTSGATATDDAQTLLVVNELLAYVSFYRDQATTDALHKAAVGFYLPSEITEAKRRLIAKFATQLTDCPNKVARRQSASRAAHDAEAEDIIRIVEALDDQNALNRVKFTASTLDRIYRDTDPKRSIYAALSKNKRA
jgi:hypothetical protein